MICNKCSAENKEDAAVCAVCGNDLNCQETDINPDGNNSENEIASPTLLQNGEEVNPQNVKEDVLKEQEVPSGVPVSPLQPPVVTPVYVTPIYQPVYPVYAVNEYVAVLPKEGASKLVQVLKKLACSPLMIVAAASLTVNIVCSFLALFNVFGAGETLMSEASVAFEMFGIGFDITSISSVFDMLFFAVELLAGITSVLMLVGIWYTVIQGFFKGPRFRTLGLSIIKGVQISYIVFVSVALVPLLLLLVSALGFKAVTEGIIGNNLIIMLFVLMVYAIIALIFYSCANGSIGAVKRSIKFGDAFGSSSGFVAVSSILMAIVHCYSLVKILENGFVESILSSVTGIDASVYVSNGTFATANVMMIISTISAIVASVCFGAVIFVHKYKLNKIIDESYKN